MFLNWPGNKDPSEIEAVCLLALVLMLPPSDGAPRARTMNPETFLVEQIFFSLQRIKCSFMIMGV